MRRVNPLAWPALLIASPAAGETTRSFEVSARIVAGCIVTTDAGGRWGSIDLGTVSGVAGGNAEGTLLSTAAAGLSIECTPGISALLAADAGGHAVAGERHLRRAGGSERIAYRLYLDAGTAPWTSGPVPVALGGGARIVPVRAVATLAAPAPAGHYTDTVRVTLSW